MGELLVVALVIVVADRLAVTAVAGRARDGAIDLLVARRLLGIPADTGGQVVIVAQAHALVVGSEWI